MSHKPKPRRWSAAQTAKFKATMRAKREGTPVVMVSAIDSPAMEVRWPAEQRKDAIVYLRHARDSVTARIKSGKLKGPDMAHALAMLALSALEGEQ